MKSRRTKTIIILFLIAFLFSFGLLQYHYSFNPYTWLNPAIEDDYSRGLWLERRNIYALMTLLTFSGFFFATGFGFIELILTKRSKLNLK